MPQSKYEELKSRMCGPVYPIPPAFNDDYSINYDAVARYVELLNGYNVRTLMVTAGTSRMNLLTDTEISMLNRTVVEANQGKAVTIVANPMMGSTAKAIEFAQEAEEIGADVILLYYPERYYNDDRVLAYFQTVAASTQIGLMVHAIPMRNAYAAIMPRMPFSVDLCERFVTLDNVVGIKEESDNVTLRYKLGTRLGDKWSIIVAGGSMRTFLSCVLFGVNAYLVGIGNFVPQIEEDFYQAVLDKDYEASLNFVTQYEEPFFDVAFPMGWHIAMKGAMNLLGLMPITERPPLQPADSAEREQLREVLTKLGWL